MKLELEMGGLPPGHYSLTPCNSGQLLASGGVYLKIFGSAYRAAPLQKPAQMAQMSQPTPTPTWQECLGTVGVSASYLPNCACHYAKAYRAKDAEETQQKEQSKLDYAQRQIDVLMGQLKAANDKNAHMDTVVSGAQKELARIKEELGNVRKSWQLTEAALTVNGNSLIGLRESIRQLQRDHGI